MPTPPQLAADATARQRFAAALGRAAAAGPSALLTPTPDGLLLVAGDRVDDAVTPLPLDLAALTHDMAAGAPPTAAALERLIMTVEDAVMPAASPRWHGRILLLDDARLGRVARLAGARLGDIEALYRRLAAVASGRPMQQDPSLPLDAGFSTALVALREIMHHLGFEQVRTLV